MDNRPIGIFDSGLGGLNAVKEVSQILPNENIVYFGDTGRVPYGNKSVETIEKFSYQNSRFLKSKNVKIMIVACGTASSVVNFNDRIDVPYIEVVRPTCYAAKQATKNGKIGVIGTQATINSHSYKNRLLKKNPEFQIFEKACPLFVPLVENGITNPDDTMVKIICDDYLSEFKDKDIDTLILGCTHYPLLSSAIQNTLGKDVTLINAGKEAAVYTSIVLEKSNMLNGNKEKGNAEFYVSDTPQDFENIASIFLGENIANKVTQINIEEY